MADRKPDESKRTQECKDIVAKTDRLLSCPNMIETGGGFEGEQYRCEVCGAAVYLDYEDMK